MRETNISRVTSRIVASTQGGRDCHKIAAYVASGFIRRRENLLRFAISEAQERLLWPDFPKMRKLNIQFMSSWLRGRNRV